MTSRSSIRYSLDVQMGYYSRFDIGTSYTRHAYSDKLEIATNTINLNEWTGNSTLDPKAKSPTTVLLNGDQTFDSFG